MTRDHRRFAQLVRKLVREHVKAEREAPAFSLWVSDAGDPRAAAVVLVGAAENADDVRVRAVDAIMASGAHWCALGRLLQQGDPDALEATSLFGLVTFGRGEAVPTAWAVDVVAGRIGAWMPWEMSPASVYAPFAFAQAALDRVAKREES